MTSPKKHPRAAAPRPDHHIPAVRVTRAAADAVRRGHPWVWRDAIARAEGLPSAGSEVQLVDGEGAVLAYGLADPTSPIAVRVWAHGDPDERHAAAAASGRVTAALFRARVESAQGVRARALPSGTDAYRVLNGEGDRTPGFVVDRYAHAAVVRTDGDSAKVKLEAWIDPLWDTLRAAGVETLLHRSGVKGQPTVMVLAGPEDDRLGGLVCHEHGVPFVVDLLRGQKTGAFLDQRENRRRVGTLARGRRVLNLFSYAGGFSLHAALGGAERVTSVDVAAAGHATAQKSFRLAGVDIARHSFVTADVFAFLADAKRRGEVWDLVISDPPSFAPSAKALPRALTAYRALHRACIDVLAPAGTFCAASCSSHVDAEAFASTLDDASIGHELRLVELHGAPFDHPTLPAWPEGRYLKFAVLA